MVVLALLIVFSVFFDILKLNKNSNDIGISFKPESFKKNCYHPLETSTIPIWETNLLRPID